METHHVPELKPEALGDLDGGEGEKRLAGDELGHLREEEEPARRDMNEILQQLNDISRNNSMDEEDK